MTESEALARMIAPSTPRQSKWRQGVIQICVTSSCDKSCYNCTQASNLARPLWVMTPDQFQAAVESLRGYFGVIGVFGGNPALSKHFPEYCSILRDSWVPKEQRGIWCNNPVTPENAKEMRATFNPSYSNLNVHLDPNAYDMFKRYWPESMPVGLREDSRHSPPWVAMKDVLKKDCSTCNGSGSVDQPIRSLPGESWPIARCKTCNGTGKVYDESRAWELISNCDINQRWSAMIGVFRGELRAWFCEVAGAQAMLHQWDETVTELGNDLPPVKEYPYPDTGLDPTRWYGYSGQTSSDPNNISTGAIRWWQLHMQQFREQVRKHCHDCGVPLRGYGELAQQDDRYGKEQVSATHAKVYSPKRKGRTVEVVTDLVQLGIGKIQVATNYIQNAAR